MRAVGGGEAALGAAHGCWLGQGSARPAAQAVPQFPHPVNAAKG